MIHSPPVQTSEPVNFEAESDTAERAEMENTSKETKSELQDSKGISKEALIATGMYIDHTDEGSSQASEEEEDILPSSSSDENYPMSKQPDAVPMYTVSSSDSEGAVQQYQSVNGAGKKRRIHRRTPQPTEDTDSEEEEIRASSSLAGVRSATRLPTISTEPSSEQTRADHPAPGMVHPHVFPAGSDSDGASGEID